MEAVSNRRDFDLVPPSREKVSLGELYQIIIDGHRIAKGLILRRVTRVDVKLPLIHTKWGNRRKISVTVNFTPACRPQQPHGAHCVDDMAADTEWAREIRDLVDDHAFRRLQILYYQFVAYWNEGVTVTQGKTMDQSGCSPCGDCQAAHSSLLANLEDNWTEVYLDRVHDKVTPELQRKLYVLGVSESQVRELMRNNSVTADELYKDLTTDERVHLLALSTHLYHVSNATVELPAAVNNCDSTIERVLRPYGVELLNRVSKEGLDPYKALELFVDELQVFFENALAELQAKVECYKTMREVEADLIGLERRIQSGERVNPVAFVKQYLQGLREMNTLMNDAYTMNAFSPSVNPKKRLLGHRKEDLTLHDQYVKNLSSSVKTMQKEELRDLIEWLIAVTTEKELGPHPLEDALEETSVTRMRADVKAYLMECDSIKLLCRDDEELERTFSALQHKIAKAEPASLEPWNKIVAFFENALTSMDLEQTSSVLPSEELLLGGNDLEEQKLEVLAKRYDVVFT